MKNWKRYTVTSALPYANGPLHIGHIAGAYLPADIYVRFLRKLGKDVAFICGSDEHGAAITIQAKKEGVSPQEIVDKYHHKIGSAFKGLNINFDIFHRTSSKLHHETATAFFSDLYEKGIFEEQVSEQYYDAEFDQFLADRYIKGGCPKCGNSNAYGDQCEQCGSSLSPLDLINPTSTLSGKKPELKQTKHWFLPLNQFETWLKKWIVEGEDRNEEWKKNVAGQCRSWLEEGLKPRAITRDLDWGVKVPLADAAGKVLYVWLDAPIGYISATKQWAADNGKDWKPYWQDKETKLLHFIGKDNIVFHCLIFPSILKAAGNYIIPTNVPANEFMNLQGQKISTSRNWAVWVHKYLNDFPEKADILRYVLSTNLPETKDSEFTWEDFMAKNNNELVAVIGNYLNRLVVLSKKYFNGKIAQLDLDKNIKKAIDNTYNLVEEEINQYRFRQALTSVVDLAREGNKYLADNEPWKLIKQNEKVTASILTNGIYLAWHLSSLLEPFMPETAKKMQVQLGQSSYPTWSNSNQALDANQIDENHNLIFSKIEQEQIDEQIKKLGKVTETSENKFEPLREEISYDDFMKMDMRVGTILSAEKMQKADRLLVFEIDLGFEKRTIVSGIAEYFNPEELIGKQVTVLANLAPRKLRGVESQGMILMSEDADGKLHLIQPETKAENGGQIS